MEPPEDNEHAAIFSRVGGHMGGLAGATVEVTAAGISELKQ
jgi:hypothetical protein